MPRAVHTLWETDVIKYCYKNAFTIFLLLNFILIANFKCTDQFVFKLIPANFQRITTL